MIEAYELKLFIDNDGETYRRQHGPAIENLCRKKAKGTYDTERAVKMFEHTAEIGAQRYTKELGSPGDTWRQMFPVAVRRETARMLRDSFETEYAAGGYK